MRYFDKDARGAYRNHCALLAGAPGQIYISTDVRTCTERQPKGLFRWPRRLLTSVLTQAPAIKPLAGRGDPSAGSAVGGGRGRWEPCEGSSREPRWNRRDGQKQLDKQRLYLRYFAFILIYDSSTAKSK